MIGMLSGVPSGAIKAQQALMASPQTVSQPITANTTVAPVASQPAPSLGVAVPQTGLIGSEQALTQSKDQALGTLNDFYWMARNESDAYRKALNNRDLSIDSTPSASVTAPINEAVANFDPYMKSGASADKLYADMTGVNGPEAQAAAQAAYKSSPALQYQIDEMQKVTERSAAARGGLLGGRVALELQKNAQGLASQDYFKNLSAINEGANRGVTAAGQVGNLKATQAGIAGNLQSQAMQAKAQYEMQKEQIRNDVATRLTGLAENIGLNIAGIQTGYGEAVAGGRTQAARDIAANATAAANQLSTVLQNQGIQISDMMGKDIASLTDMIYQSGMQDKTDMANLAAILANINGGQASNIMQGQQTIGAAQAGGTIGVANAVNQGIGTYLAYGGGSK